MDFWEGFFKLPEWFIMSFLSISLLGILLVLNELANRKLKIDKSGVTFDRLREKKSLLLRLLKFRHDSKKKIPIETLVEKKQISQRAK